MAGELVKGLIGKEDCNIQYNTATSETFARKSSTGGTTNLTKIPDIWSGTGKVDVGEIEAVLAELVRADIVAIGASNAQGDVYYHNGTTITRLGAGTKGKALTTGGSGANPSYEGMTTQGDVEYHNGTTRTRLAAGTAGKALTTGGSGANPSFEGMTTEGDIEYHNGTTRTRLAKGTALQQLRMNAGATAPEWGAQNSVVQVVNTQSGAVATGTTLIPIDDTIPQITEGDEYMTRTITPTSATNKLKIEVVLHGAKPVASPWAMALFQDAVANALAAAGPFNDQNNQMDQATLIHYMTAGTTSEITFRVRAGGSASGTFTFNGQAAGRLFGGVLASSITITEYKA